MKIAIDVRSLMEGQVSGVGQYTQQIVRALSRHSRHELHVFYNAARAVTLPELGENIIVHGFRYPNKVLNSLQWMVAQPSWDRLLPAVDVVFAPSLRLIPLSSGVPLVSVVHDLSYEHFPEFFDIRRRVWHRMMRPKALARRSQAIIAVSEHTKHDLMNVYGVPEGKIHVVYSGVNDGSLASSRTKLDRPTRAPGRSEFVQLRSLPARFILYLGTLEPRKNVDSLVRAYSAIADRIEQDLVIAGAPGWLMRKLVQAIDLSPVRERIHVLGFVPEEKKAALYAAADVFVYPSLYEGFGFPPLEALLAGTPVITSFNSSLPEIVGPSTSSGQATLIDPYNVSELALVLQEVLREKPTVSEETKAAIREQYSWDRAAQETLRVLETVA